MRTCQVRGALRFSSVDKLDGTTVRFVLSFATMTGLITSVSGLLPSRLTVGTLLPVVVFVLLVHVAVAPLVPERWEVADAVAQLEPEWRLAMVSFLAVLLTGLLYVLNVPLIRLYEGYAWQESALGRWMTRRQRARLAALETSERFLGHLVRELLAVEPASRRIDELRRRRDAAGRRRVGAYPKSPSVLPTRLGNTIRAFENYPHRQYEMSGVELWPRLAPLVPADHVAAIEAAKTRFDFMLNASALSALLGALVLTGAVLAPLQPGDGTGAELVATVACFGLSLAFYRGSVGRADAWGTQVKSAFDLHRRKLLAELGFEGEPATLLEERRVWQDLRLQLAHLDPWDGSPPTLAFRSSEPPVPPIVRTTTKGHGLNLARGVEPLGDGELRVVLQVENGTSEASKDVEVVDALQPGWEYAWGTATVDGNTAGVWGSRDLRLVVGTVPPAGRVEVAYVTVVREHRRKRKRQEAS